MAGMDSRLTDLSVTDLVARLATDDPIPGGGSASALAGATAAALVHMVVELTSGRPGADEHADALTELKFAAAGLQSDLLRLVEIDAAAYASVVRARRLPRDDDREREMRRVQIVSAVREATEAPLEIARRAAQVLHLAERLAPIGSRHAVSDVGVAGVLAVAALRGAAMNVEINLPSLPDGDALRDEAAQALAGLLVDLDDRDRALRSAVGGRIG
jgi:formiminotetrahydrofolate cyclodeaminase